MCSLRRAKGLDPLGRHHLASEVSGDKMGTICAWQVRFTVVRFVSFFLSRRRRALGVRARPCAFLEPL